MSPPEFRLRIAAASLLLSVLPFSVTAAQTQYGRAMISSLTYSGTMYRYQSLDDARNQVGPVSSTDIGTTRLFIWAWNDPFSQYEPMHRELLLQSLSDPQSDGAIQHFDQPDGVTRTSELIQTMRTGWDATFTTFILSVTGISNSDCCSDLLAGLGALPAVQQVEYEGNIYNVPVPNGYWREYSLYAEFTGIDPSSLEPFPAAPPYGDSCGSDHTGWQCIGGFDLAPQNAFGSFKGIFEDLTQPDAFFVVDYVLGYDPEGQSALFSGDRIVPEPGLLSLLIIGLASLVVAAHHRFKVR